MWLNWLIAWFIRIPGADHDTKVALLTIVQDPDFVLMVRVNDIVQQVKTLRHRNT
jgi:hypothetical protein